MPDYSFPDSSLISFFSNKVKKYGGINFAQGIPGYLPPPELIKSLREILDKDIHQYAPGKGNSSLLKLIIESYKEYSIPEKSVLITQGATEAIALTYIYLSQQFDHFTVMSFDPVYESYIHLPEIFKHKFVTFRYSERNEIDFNELEKEIIRNKIHLLMISSPGNPFGKVFTSSEMDSLIKLSEKHNFFILFDAVYKDLYFHDKIYLPLKGLHPNIFYVNSFSKMLSVTGWRIGYLIANEEHMKKIETIHDYIGLCAPSLLQEAIAGYLAKNNYGAEYTFGLRMQLRESFKLLSESLLSSGFSMPEINGGYFIWAKLPEKYPDGFKFAIDLYDSQKVAVIPGIHFSEYGKQFIRLNIAREKTEILEGLELINKFLKN